MAVNLKSAWMTIKHTIPVMREQGGGSIVNISSLASLAGGNQVAYEVSKAGVNRLTTSVANANAGHGVRCNAVLPGLMDTPMAVTGIAEAIGSTTSGGARSSQRPRTAARQDGNRLGHRLRRPVPGLGRGPFHYRRAAARGRRDGGAHRLTTANCSVTSRRCFGSGRRWPRALRSRCRKIRPRAGYHRHVRRDEAGIAGPRAVFCSRSPPARQGAACLRSGDRRTEKIRPRPDAGRRSACRGHAAARWECRLR